MRSHSLQTFPAIAAVAGIVLSAAATSAAAAPFSSRSTAREDFDALSHTVTQNFCPPADVQAAATCVRNLYSYVADIKVLMNPVASAKDYWMAERNMSWNAQCLRASRPDAVAFATGVYTLPAILAMYPTWNEQFKAAHHKSEVAEAKLLYPDGLTAKQAEVVIAMGFVSPRFPTMDACADAAHE
jgi:hypothetical protein